MSSKLKSILLKYGITALIGALMVFIVMRNYGYADAATQVDKVLILSNAFTIPGVILIMVGFLVMASNEGAFNGISYAMSYAVRMLIPGGGAAKQEKYGDYVMRRREKEKAKVGFIFLVGLVYLVVAIVFTVLFYQI